MVDPRSFGSLSDVLDDHRKACSRHVNSGSNQHNACDYAVLACALQTELALLEETAREESRVSVQLANIRIPLGRHRERAKAMREHMNTFLSKRGV